MSLNAVNPNDVTRFINAAIASDTGSWFESQHCKIWGKDRSKGMIRPTRNSLQIKACDVINKMRELELPIRLVGLKPRQRGSTTFYSAELYCWLRREATSACVIAGQYSQTTEIQEMLKTYAKADTFDWKNTGEVNSKEGRWSNGSRLKFETAGDKLAGVASTLQALLCSEVARWAKLGVANASEVMSNLLKCVPLLPKTIIIVESTAEGNSGSYYERWQTAVDAEAFLSGDVTLEPGMYVRLFSPWFDFEDSAIRLTPEQERHVEKTLDADDDYAGEKELIELYGKIGEDGILRLGNCVTEFSAWEQLAWRRFSIREECQRDLEIFNRDNPHSADVAFLKSGSLRFNATGVAILKKRSASVPPVYGTLEKTTDGRFAFRQSERNEAKFVIYEKPTPGYRYILAVDPMTGITQTGGVDPDRHGVFVLRAGFWDKAGKWRRAAAVARIVQCRWDIGVIEPEIWALSRYYGGQSGAKIIIEMNADKGLTELLKLRSADLYQRELFNQREQKTTKAYGFLTTEKSRETLVETMATAIREWDTDGAGIDIWDKDAIDQYANFVRKENGRSEAGEGWKDDDVFAISLGLTAIQQATPYFPDRSFGLPPDLRPIPGQGQRTPSAYS